MWTGHLKVGKYVECLLFVAFSLNINDHVLDSQHLHYLINQLINWNSDKIELHLSYRGKHKYNVKIFMCVFVCVCV